MLLTFHSTFKKVLIAIGMFLITVSILAYLGLQNIEQQVRKDIGKSLETILQTTQESHSTWIEEHKSHLQVIAKNPQLIALVKKQLKTPRTPQLLLNSLALKELRLFFDTQRGRLQDIGFFIISPDYINIGSMRDQNIGLTNLIQQQRPSLLSKAFNGETVFIPPLRSDISLQNKSLKNSPTMFFVTPIIEQNKASALLAIRIAPNQDFTRLTQIGRIGESGETYAFDRTGLMISNSRFNHQLDKIGIISKNDETILNIRVSDPGGNLLRGHKPDNPSSHQPLTFMANSAISGHTALNIQGYRDYRGVTVLGAWHWNDSLGYGLATEIDEREALKSYQITKNIIINLILITLFLASSLTLIIYWLEQRASLMLKKSHDDLEIKVNQRTNELSITNAELKKSIEDLNVLKGIIPICSYCKNIRNDTGSWQLLEKYIQDNSSALFSHGICPDCLKKELANIKKEE